MGGFENPAPAGTIPAGRTPAATPAWTPPARFQNPDLLERALQPRPSPDAAANAARMTLFPREPAIPDGAMERVIEGAAETALSILPGSGEAMSLEDYFDSMAAANRADGWAKVPHYAHAATALIGAIPLLGTVARGAKKAGQAAESLVDALTHADDVVAQPIRNAGIGDPGNLLEARPPVTSHMRRIDDVPARPIEADYPKGVPADDTGTLRESIEGTPLTAPFIAGRRSATGLDQALQPEDVVTVGEGLIGRRTEAVPSRALPRGALGAYITRPGIDGPERYIQVHDRLEGVHRDNVIAHEVGHAIDDIAQGRTGIPLTGSVRQFNALYHVQNDSGAWTSVADPAYRQTRPEHLGYRRDDARAEKVAEGIRLYMQNPATMKEHFPNAARRIREHVNANPRLNRTIQFNEAGVPIGASWLALTGRGGSEETSAPEPEGMKGRTLLF
jgi:hypothetical protein